MNKTLLPCLTLIALLVAATTLAADRITGHPFATRSEVIAEHGIAANAALGLREPTGQLMASGGTAFLEQGIAYEVLRDLSEMGHRIQINVGSFGGYQAILFDKEQGVYYGASESRKDGQAAGY